MSKTSTRINRQIANMPSEAWGIRAWFHSPNQYKAMVAAAEKGKPPIQAVSGILVWRFPSVKDSNALKQFIGLVVHEVMEKQGFEKERSGIRLHNDPIFATSSSYVREKNVAAEKPSPLGRWLNALTLQEKQTALEILKKQLA